MCQNKYIARLANESESSVSDRDPLMNLWLFCRKHSDGEFKNFLSPIILSSISLFLASEFSASCFGNNEEASLLLHPRSLCFFADSDATIRQRMSKSVFSGFSGAAEFL